MVLLDELKLNFTSIELGEIEIKENISENKQIELSENFKKYGFELVIDNKKIIVEKIKHLIIKLIQNLSEYPKINISEYLSKELNKKYKYLGNVFSAIEGFSIEQFIIMNKIEKAKQLLIQNELTVKEIAFELHYSSVGHLSNQFKSFTGLSPSQYKELNDNKYLGIYEIIS